MTPEKNNPVYNLKFSLFAHWSRDVLLLLAPPPSHWCSASSSDFFSFHSSFAALDAALCLVLSLKPDSAVRPCMRPRLPPSTLRNNIMNSGFWRVKRWKSVVALLQTSL